jgi:hypothetical protein
VVVARAGRAGPRKGSDGEKNLLHENPPSFKRSRETGEPLTFRSESERAVSR